MRFFPTIKAVQEISGLSKPEAKKLYRKLYSRVLFSRYGVVGIAIALLAMAVVHFIFGEMGRVVGWFLGPYLMYVYLFNKIQFEEV